MGSKGNRWKKQIITSFINMSYKHKPSTTLYIIRRLYREISFLPGEEKFKCFIATVNIIAFCLAFIHPHALHRWNAERHWEVLHFI